MSQDPASVVRETTEEEPELTLVRSVPALLFSPYPHSSSVRARLDRLSNDVIVLTFQRENLKSELQTTLEGVRRLRAACDEVLK
jgi:hypothetical protein